ncbi:uncharacterized protein [Pagrus major]|uniref:uncharacterized protein n=1 Tax=Pagrus major TaxID=143350 RepID=UPI003CC8910B
MVLGLQILYFKMWLWILIGLSIITKAHGFANGNFPQVCQSMSPEHSPFAAQSSEPPFEVTYQHGKRGEPITVILRSKTATTFEGFMLEARVKGTVDESPPIGTFILTDPDRTQILTCSNPAGSAVSQSSNHRKSLIKVNWTAPAEELDITFRATFVQVYNMFWERVDVDVIPPPTTTAPPTTTTSTTKPTTATSTTKPTTATSTRVPSATSTTKPTTPTPILPKLQPAGTALMAFDILFVVLKTAQAHIVTTTLTKSFCSRCLIMVSKTSCGLLCAALEISSLTLFSVAHPFNVTLVALVCVVIVVNFTELVIDSVSVRLSHEQKKICNIVVQVCSVIHLIFSTAVVFIGVLEIVDCRENRNKSWLLKVMIAYTVWLLLFVIWVFIFSVHKHAMLGRNKSGSSSTNKRRSKQRERKKLSAAAKIATAVSVILIVGTMSFTAAVIGGIFSGNQSCA